MLRRGFILSKFAFSRRLETLPVAQRGRKFLTTVSDPTSPHRIAIVGSGPSACYSAKYLQAAWKKAGKAIPQIDMLERLPTPYGLVRYGVAPDHPEVKNVTSDFDQLFQNGEIDDSESSSDRVRFFGNVQVGRDVSVAQLRQMYHAVILATGCETDRRLNIPGSDESLEGILSAREFVNWYNGHPDYLHIGKQVAAALGPDPRRARVCVIGQGNVALDCARIVAKGSPGLSSTDIASHALSVLQDGVDTVTIVGRRGHVQGAFTIKELRELVKLKQEGHNTAFVVREDELNLGATEASLAELNGPGGRPRVRMDKLLREAATAAITSNDNNTDSASKVIHLRFLMNPVAFEAHPDNSNSLGSVRCERTRLEGEARQQRAVGTGEYESIPADLALVSIGYKGIALSGVEQWFDDSRGAMIHQHGKVDAPTSTMGGLYTVGWLKRGPSGIIGSNIMDAKDTVATIVQDAETEFNAIHLSSTSLSALDDLLADCAVVTWEGYQRIEAAESSGKRSEDQPREKIVDLHRQIEIATSGKD